MAEEKKDVNAENTQQGAGDGDNTQGNAAATQQGTTGDDKKKPTAKKAATGASTKKPAAKKETAKKQESGNSDGIIGDGTIGDGTIGDGTISGGNATLKKIGKEALKRNPWMRTVFVTTDGVAFGSHNDAENHAKTLENKGVEVVTE